jgi:multidrug resistance efflux pump
MQLLQERIDALAVGDKSKFKLDGYKAGMRETLKEKRVDLNKAIVVSRKAFGKVRAEMQLKTSMVIKKQHKMIASINTQIAEQQDDRKIHYVIHSKETASVVEYKAAVETARLKLPKAPTPVSTMEAGKGPGGAANFAPDVFSTSHTGDVIQVRIHR